MEIKSSISIRSRTYFSIQHVQSAALFAGCAFKIEKDYKGVHSDELFSQHRAYVTGSILSSVCFLEAAINELFADSVEANSSVAKKLGTTASRLMSAMWKLGIPRTATFKILQKYQIALTMAQKEIFDTNALPYQDVDLLIRLRNDLVHYEPEWVKLPSSDDFDTNDIHKTEKMLRGKFLLNPLTEPGNPFYPDKCLGHGCAEWAINSCIEFADDFYSRMSSVPSYDHVRSRLHTK
jgi:hypothetical protein